MEHDNLNEGLGASFDIVARQEAADAALHALRSEIEEVKSRFRAPARPPLSATPGGQHEMKGFVDGYLRAGRDHELKSLNTAVMGDGGFVVPTALDQQIAERLVRLSPIRAIAQVVQTTTSDYRKLIATGAPQSGWASQTAARSETTAPKFAEIIPPSGELYANPSATQFMLDDAGFDVESWLAGQIAGEFARAEGAAFVSGNGTNQPLGFLTGGTSAADDVSRTFGTLQHLGSAMRPGWALCPMTG